MELGLRQDNDWKGRTTGWDLFVPHLKGEMWDTGHKVIRISLVWRFGLDLCRAGDDDCPGGLVVIATVLTFGEAVDPSGVAVF